ncbi:glycosyltransferase family 2 protein [uncultured Methylobacterium sp.]|jgi:GT2 family glycosyltransferase|uniref:glycosyltransferase n=1 Tax=uncultured Methylobacterium sp. TaxID=157278 RepID=UPI002607C16A|nr:glycosyltransferase family 2 protein [uncultured Methylobacterium sp.]
MLKTSIIIASYGRPAQLATTLRRFPVKPMWDFGAELILVGSAPDENTAAVFKQYAEIAPFTVKWAMASDPGFAHAQNVGLTMSEGELIVFTDDDCYVEESYLSTLHAKFDRNAFQYGCGEIGIVHPEDDPVVANTEWWSFEERVILPPHSLIAPGAIQGANMFFLREVLATTGGICQVGPLDNNDIMTAYLASRAGYTGVMLRGPKVYHDHGRKRNSPEAQRTRDIYAKITGAYFAQLIAIGKKDVFEFWKTRLHGPGGAIDFRRLELELRAAADELAWLQESSRPERSAKVA